MTSTPPNEPWRRTNNVSKANAVSMLPKRRRRWDSIDTALGQL